jgi:hypothetical protein
MIYDLEKARLMGSLLRDTRSASGQLLGGTASLLITVAYLQIMEDHPVVETPLSMILPTRRSSGQMLHLQLQAKQV